MKSLLRTNVAYIFFILSAMILTMVSCQNPRYIREEGMIWNTTYHITYQNNRSLSDSILKVLKEVESSLSIFDKSSLVNLVNNTDSAEIDSHFKTVYLVSRRINLASGGMFDPTLAPLIKAWGFGPGHTISTDTAKADSVKNFVGLDKTRLKDHKIIKDDPRIQFNFSAVAKGYGCDQVAEMLKRNGVNNFLVEIGGEISVSGENPTKGDWKVSIDAPIETDTTEIHDACAVIAISNCGVATSGNYRNFHKTNGKTLGHTISPITGRPVTSDVISATVIAPTCMEADAAATACMAAGSQIAKRMLAQLGYEGMLIMADSVWTSSNFPKNN